MITPRKSALGPIQLSYSSQTWHIDPALTPLNRILTFITWFSPVFDPLCSRKRGGSLLEHTCDWNLLTIRQLILYHSSPTFV